MLECEANANRRPGNRVPLVLEARAGSITSLTSGLPSRETCTHGPPASARRWPRPSSASCAGSRRSTRRAPRLPSSGRWGPSRRLVSREIGIWIAIVWMFSFLQLVNARRRRCRDQVQVLERPQVAEVERRAEVDEEAVLPLPGEHGLAASRACASPPPRAPDRPAIERGPTLQGGHASPIRSRGGPRRGRGRPRTVSVAVAPPCRCFRARGRCSRRRSRRRRRPASPSRPGACSSCRVSELIGPVL